MGEQYRLAGALCNVSCACIEFTSLSFTDLKPPYTPAACDRSAIPAYVFRRVLRSHAAGIQAEGHRVAPKDKRIGIAVDVTGVGTNRVEALYRIAIFIDRLQLVIDLDAAEGAIGAGEGLERVKRGQEMIQRAMLKQQKGITESRYPPCQIGARRYSKASYLTTTTTIKICTLTDALFFLKSTAKISDRKSQRSQIE